MRRNVSHSCLAVRSIACFISEFDNLQELLSAAGMEIAVSSMSSFFEDIDHYVAPGHLAVDFHKLWIQPVPSRYESISNCCCNACLAREDGNKIAKQFTGRIVMAART